MSRGLGDVYKRQAPVIGYEKAAKIAKEAHKSGQTVLETSLELTDLSEEELIEILNPEKMVKPSD